MAVGQALQRAQMLSAEQTGKASWRELRPVDAHPPGTLCDDHIGPASSLIVPSRLLKPSIPVCPEIAPSSGQASKMKEEQSVHCGASLGLEAGKVHGSRRVPPSPLL
ncbi:hypothetical protein E4U42_006717 [Claviceps africana]|uniref:Uncharacterized protein n=1 Tax=Claviceps africana TaxID=83212 RepID=A0A8K0J2N5_9HYPO|nr:hypothetical protein E4U42_006717 [Claviceps africana]